MKKIFKSLLVLVMCVCTCLTFVGCGETKWSETTNNTEGVVSNGGMLVHHSKNDEHWLYFINGTKTNNEANNKGKNVQAGIYRVKTDAQGNILYKEEPTTAASDDKKEDKKEFLKIEPVVQSLVGFDDASLFIFGDYLYYATPCKRNNSDGDMLFGRTEFRRYDLVNKQSQLIYTSKASDDTLTYTYYKQGKNLNLVVYEKNSALLTSISIGNQIKTVFSKTDVKSAVLSDNFGEVSNVSESVADCYIYYTLSYDAESTVTTGVRVFRILPDGKEEKKISEGKDVTLLSVREGSLIYSYNEHIYAQNILNSTTELLFTENQIVCYNSYDNIIFVKDGGKICALVYDNGAIRRIKWVPGESAKDNIVDIYDDLDSDDKVGFIGVDGDYLIYQLSNLMYKVKYKNLTAGEENREIKLSTTKFNEPTENSLLIAETVNGYLYGLYTDTNVTYMYRISLTTPRELGETNDDGSYVEVGAAEFVGVKE